MLTLLTLLACAPEPEPGWAFPDPDEGPPLRGPGGPTASFDESELWQGCASLTGGDEDVLHHNLVMPYRGHLVLPWAPEFGGGGLAFFEMNDPCQPVRVGTSFSRYMRETHAIAFLHLPDDDPQAGDYAVVTGNLGVQVWDITDYTAPVELAYLTLPNVFYPDAYARVVLSVFWQYPYLYVAGADNGLYIVDTSTLAEPEQVGEYSFDPVLRAGGVFALGNTLMVSSAEGKKVGLLDISTPTEPQPIGGGLFEIQTAEGVAVEAYHANRVGDLALFARKEGGGGVIAYDVSDPTQPTYYGEGFSEGGNGGYVFYHEGLAFVGDSHWGRVYDLSAAGAFPAIGTATLPGDQDTFVPYGNVAVLSVDDDAEDGIASSIIPWSTTPDARGPVVLAVDPPDGATGLPPTARVGVGFDEIIEPSSFFQGSIRLYDDDGSAVQGWTTAQETIGTYTPKQALKAGHTYTLEVMPGGVTDINGNAVAEKWSSIFTIAGTRSPDESP